MRWMEDGGQKKTEHFPGEKQQSETRRHLERDVANVSVGKRLVQPLTLEILDLFIHLAKFTWFVIKAL